MQRGNLIKVAGNIINMMLHAYADTFGKIYNDPWLQNTDSTVARQVFIIVYPVIIAVKAKAHKFIKVKCLFNLCFKPAAKIIIPEKRSVRPIAGIVTGQWHCRKMQ